MNIQQARHSSAAFFAASTRCLEERRVGEAQFEMLLVPGIVCAVFSIELGFKAILLSAGTKPANDHKLLQLFGKLSPWVQNEIVQAVGLERTAFMTELSSLSNAFVEWRYVYEHMEQAKANMGFLHKLSTATQRSVQRVTGRDDG